MSDDLISRKALLKELREIMDEPHNTMFLMGIGAAVSIVEHRETAFDKEEVIDELKSAENYLYVNGIRITNFKFIHTLTAIEIVEKGGIEFLH